MSTAVTDAPQVTNSAAHTPPSSAAPVASPASVPATNATAAVVPAAGVAAAQPVRLLADSTAEKPVDASKAANDSAAVEAKPAENAKAEAASWSLKAPEGVDAASVTAVETFAKESGLSLAQAEKVLARDLAAKQTYAESQKSEAAKIGDTWADEARKHPEIGGEKLTGAVKNAQKALLAWATADERKAIASSPFANNPMFIAILNRAAAALPAEDGTHVSAAAAAPMHPAQILYSGKYK